VFLKRFLDSCNLPLMGLINGIAVPKLNQENMNSIMVPIPPMAEQKRIVARLEELLPLCERLK
jgi:type I restriction enzyme S subunit